MDKSHLNDYGVENLNVTSTVCDLLHLDIGHKEPVFLGSLDTLFCVASI